MKSYTLTFHRRGSTRHQQAKVFCDSLTGAEKALIDWEDMNGHDIIITNAKENSKCSTQ